MANGSVGIDPGASPSVEVAVDTIADVNFQRNKLVDGTEGSTSAIGVNANPLKVQPRVRGTADYDSGISAVPNTSTAVTATTTYVDKILVTNASDTQRTFSLTNTAGGEIISQFPIAPRNTHVFDLGGMEMVGIKWLASASSAIRGQIKGWQ